MRRPRKLTAAEYFDKLRMRLPHDEADESKRYSMVNPDALRDLYDSARREIIHETRHPGAPVTLTYDEACALEALANNYLFLTTNGLGQECAVSKLRDIWRARRERQS